jgi:class I fructose-bisphosphate aldolase
MSTIDRLYELLGEEAEDLLSYTASGIDRKRLHTPGPNFVDRVLVPSDRSPTVARNLQSILDHGRLAGSGYMSILPVDQGIEHSAGASFATNPSYFDPENIVLLALEGGCNAVASSVGVLGSVARKYASKIPFICKLNHNELLTYPNTYRQTMFSGVDRAFALGAVAVGATVYFGNEDADREIEEVSEAFSYAHDLGLVTVLWCYLRNKDFQVEAANYEAAADLTGQANHLGVSIQADIIKQKAPQTNRGFPALSFGRFDERMYQDLMPNDHPIELVRYQVANCYMGRSLMINSGGSSGKNDLAEVARAALVNKRAGGAGMITGRKAFKRPLEEGIELLQLVQDIYLEPAITLA